MEYLRSKVNVSTDFLSYHIFVDKFTDFALFAFFCYLCKKSSLRRHLLLPLTVMYMNRFKKTEV